MKLSDVIQPQDDLHAVMHRDQTPPTLEQVQARRERLKHIIEAFHQCMHTCGPCTPLPSHLEMRHAAAIIMTLDDCIEYLTERRKN